MSHKDLRDELDDEVSSMLDGSFSISITSTSTVPTPDDQAITFPNLDSFTQGTKLISTCVLYIDMRRSTDLSFAHRPQTVAKLYSAFVRAMTRAARYYHGHVRGIIGDRVMVLFDSADCYVNAVKCAIAMNTISKHIINRHFKADEVEFGIGIDHGRMLATKTGIRKHGSEQGNYRNLAWLGRPANVASKLTDAANKPDDHVSVARVRVAYENPFLPPSFGSGLGGVFGALSPLSTNPSPLSTNPFSGILATPPAGGEWKWTTETLETFVSQLEVQYAPFRIAHKRGGFKNFFLSSEEVQTREETPPILMTAAVWSGFRKAEPNNVAVQTSLFRKVNVSVPGYSGQVYGGDVIYPDLKSPK